MVTTVQGPTAGRRKLRTALRAARETAELTQEFVADAMDWSLSKLIRIENGQVSISTNDVRALLQLYDITDPRVTADLIQLARVARRKPWWQEFRDAVPKHYAQYIGLEAEASSMRCFQPTVVAGLLQTEAYARAVLENKIPGQLTSELVEARARVRLIRQREVLDRADPPDIHMILDEAVLHRLTGGVQVMRDQLSHLVRLARDRPLTIQVLPFSAGAHTPGGPFIILQFPDPDDQVVYLESAMLSENFIDNPAQTRSYADEFERLRETSLSPPESLRMIEKMAGEL